jgi:hypothetical protein
MKKTHDYVHFYRGYWSDGGKCRIRIYREDDRAPVVIRSQLPAEYTPLFEAGSQGEMDA